MKQMKNTNRRFYPWYMWEHYWAGFFNSGENLDFTEAEKTYRNFFIEEGLFEKTIPKVFKEWPISCEHNLTNKSQNRVAWLGQACVCYHTSVPSKFKAAYSKLPFDIQKKNNDIALKWIKKWEK